jgi:hypothetical protein
MSNKQTANNGQLYFKYKQPNQPDSEKQMWQHQFYIFHIHLELVAAASQLCHEGL